MEHKYADVNGVRLHYVTAGSGSLVLFLHGFPEFWYQWKKQLEVFSKTHHAVAPDLRGYNLSEKPEGVESYKMKVLIQDVRLLCEHLGAKKMVLVGHDWGGAIAWTFALRYPEYLERLIILNAPHPIVFDRELRENPLQQKASEYILFLRSQRAEEVLSQNSYGWLTEAVLNRNVKKGFLSQEDARAYVHAWSQPGALTGMLNYYRANRIGPGTEAIAAMGDFAGMSTKIHLPTLVLWGERDPFLLMGNLQGLTDWVTSLTVKRFPDISHWIVQEIPDQVNAAIREFVG